MFQCRACGERTDRQDATCPRCGAAALVPWSHPCPHPGCIAPGGHYGVHLGETVAEPASWAAEVIADASGQWVGNGLRFATREEADRYVSDLAARWTLVRATRVVPSPDPVTRP